MTEAYICEGLRTPIGRYGGALSSVRPDDMLGHVIREVMASAPGLSGENIDDVYVGCANQAGEDNRNVGRMALLLGGWLSAHKDSFIAIAEYGLQLEHAQKQVNNYNNELGNL